MKLISITNYATTQLHGAGCAMHIADGVQEPVMWLVLSAVGSFTIPRDFHKQTSFRSRPISTEQDQFETKGLIWWHMITAHLLALNHASFGTCREVSACSKKLENLWKYTFMYLTCRESSGLIFITKNANFLEFSYREQQRMQSKKINWVPNHSDSHIMEDIHTYWKNRIKN